MVPPPVPASARAECSPIGGRRASSRAPSRLRRPAEVPMLRRGAPTRSRGCMAEIASSIRIACSLGIATVALSGAFLGFAAAAGPAKVEDPAAGIALAPHRAVYDLKLGESRGKRSLEAVRGRIVYDFAGSTCEGYALQFRQVTELDTGEGKLALSDLRSTSW